MDEIKEANKNRDKLKNQFVFRGEININQVSKFRDYFTDSFIERFVYFLRARSIIIYFLECLIKNTTIKDELYFKRLFSKSFHNNVKIVINDFVKLWSRDLNVKIYFYCKFAKKALELDLINISDIESNIKYRYYDQIMCEEIEFDFQKEINKINRENAKNWDKCQQNTKSKEQIN